jgi:adenylate kinase
MNASSRKDQAMLRVILLGAPGAGKGTQAERIRDRYSLVHVSTGDIFRAAAAKQTPLGLQAKSYMDSGELVPDEVTIGLVRERLKESDCANGFLLDGFPRTLQQATALDGILKELGRELTHVLHIAVEEEELLRRIRGRAAQGSGRADDDLNVAKNRLEVYRRQTAPLIDYYSQSKRLSRIDGHGSVDDVWQRVGELLGGK